MNKLQWMCQLVAGVGQTVSRLDVFCGLGAQRRCPSEHSKATPHTAPSYEDRCNVWFTAAIDLQRAAGSGSTLGPPCPSLGLLLGRSGTAALLSREKLSDTKNGATCLG